MGRSPASKPPRARWLIAERKRRGLSVADVAEIAGVVADTVRGWEAGRSIGWESLERLEAEWGPAPDGPRPDEMGRLIAVLTDVATEMRLAREDGLGRRVEELEATLATLAAREIVASPGPDALRDAEGSREGA